MGWDVKVHTTMHLSASSRRRSSQTILRQPSILACLCNGPKACSSQLFLPEVDRNSDFRGSY